MSIDRIIHQVRHQAQVLAHEWQAEQHERIVAEVDIPKPEALTCPLQDMHVQRWRYREHLYMEAEAEQFLTAAYLHFLQREPDESGRQHYLQRLQQGMPRVFVALALQSSPEALPENRLLGLSFFKLLWMADKLLRRLPGLRPIQTWFNRQLSKQEASRIAFWQPISQLQKRLDLHAQAHEKLCQHQQVHHTRTLSQLASMTEQVAIAQAMVTETGRNFHLLQHKLNYHQHALDLFVADLAHQTSDSTLPAPVLNQHLNDRLDAYYVAFEDFNRGSREEIRHKHQPYLNIILQQQAQFPALKNLPLLDIGCGRGEWLELLTEHAIPAIGVDMNPIMVQTCQSRNLEAHHVDALSWLRQQSDASHAFISGFHIIEHLPFQTLFDIFAQAYRVLSPGGMIIFETPNPENILVGSHTFYHDFTHRNPITPTAISFLARYHNYTDIDILRLHPYPAQARVPGHDPLTERVNGHLTGPQDFALLAVKPDTAAQIHKG